MSTVPVVVPLQTPDGQKFTVTLGISVASVVAVVPPPPPPTQAPSVPSTALIVDALPMTGWEMNHDAGTSGTSSGTTSYPVTAPDGTTNCRLFDFTNSGGGGEIYHFPILKDCTPYNKFRFRFRRTAGGYTNSEHDLEAVDASGNVLDMATQEDGYNGVIDVTESHKWVGVSTVKVDPTKWVAGSWHEDQIYMIDNGDGTVTYDYITLDGVTYKIGITASDVDGGKWTAKILNIQIQFDTKAVGTTGTEAKVYCSECAVDCWHETLAVAA